MPTFTPNFNFSLPLVNDPADEDLWGGELNSNWTALDTLLENISSAGEIIFSSGNVAPTGTVIGQGALLSRTTYANLWAYAQVSGNIAATDGAWTKGQYSPGDGSTTFRTPDYRGFFLRGWDDGAGVDTGRTIGSIQTDDLKPHTHTATVTDPTHKHQAWEQTPSFGHNLTGANATSGSSAIDGATSTNASYQTNAVATGITVTNASTGTTETRPLNIAVLICIKT